MKARSNLKFPLMLSITTDMRLLTSTLVLAAQSVLLLVGLCLGENTTSTTTTSSETTVSSSWSSTTAIEAGTFFGCPLADDPAQCAFIEEVCNKTVDFLADRKDRFESWKDDPVYVDCLAGLCCACDNGKSDRAQCIEDESLTETFTVGSDVLLRQLRQSELGNATITEGCKLARLALPELQPKVDECVATRTTTEAPPTTSYGCPFVGDEAQCTFAEEVCNRTASELIDLGNNFTVWEDNPVFLNCITGLCCACDNGLSTRPECAKGVSLLGILKVSPNFPFHRIIENKLKTEANLDKFCKFVHFALPTSKRKIDECMAEKTTTTSTKVATATTTAAPPASTTGKPSPLTKKNTKGRAEGVASSFLFLMAGSSGCILY